MVGNCRSVAANQLVQDAVIHDAYSWCESTECCGGRRNCLTAAGGMFTHTRRLWIPYRR
jgi:hypothetical protein